MISKRIVLAISAIAAVTALVVFFTFALVQPDGEELADVGTEQKAQVPPPPLPKNIEPSSDLVSKEVQLVTKLTTWPTVLLGLVVSALIVSIWLNILLLKWRKAISASDVSIVPSVLLDEIDKQKSITKQLASVQAESIKRLTSQVNEVFKNLRCENEAIRNSSDELLEAFTGIRKTLDHKDTELQRYREGYDQSIFGRFLRRFVRLEKVVREEIEDARAGRSQAIDSLRDVLKLLQDALEECGLSKYEPELGQHIQDVEGLDDNPKHIPVGEEDEPFTVAEVIEPGWRAAGSDGFTYIKKARVAVFVAKEDE